MLKCGFNLPCSTLRSYFSPGKWEDTQSKLPVWGLGDQFQESSQKRGRERLVNELNFVSIKASLCWKRETRTGKEDDASSEES